MDQRISAFSPKESVIDSIRRLNYTLIRLFRRACFLIEDTVENLFEAGFVDQQSMEFFQVLRIIAPRNPDLQIAIWSVFFIEVFDSPLIMSGSVEFRIICQSILDSAPDYLLRIDETVGFGNQYSP